MCQNIATTISNQDPAAPSPSRRKLIARARFLRWPLLILLGMLGMAVLPHLAFWWRHQRYYRQPAERVMLKQSRVLSDPTLGTISDLAIGQFHPGRGEEVAMLGSEGAVFTDLTMRPHSRTGYQYAGDDVRLIRSTHGGYHFFQPGTTNRLAVMDIHGKALWVAERDSRAGTNAIGDLNGDGREAVVSGWLLPKAGCLRAIGDHGQTLWERQDSDAYFRDCAVLDVNNDGRQEVIYPDGDRLVVLDGHGKLLGTKHMPVPMEPYALCPWPRPDSAPVMITLQQAVLWLVDFDGRVLARFYVPADYGDSHTWSATPVVLRPGEPPYFAVVLNREYAMLYLYDQHGALVYQNRLAQKYPILRAVPSMNVPQAQDLLLGGEFGNVWRYALGKIVPVK